jgi:hypothetical protein
MTMMHLAAALILLQPAAPAKTPAATQKAAAAKPGPTDLAVTLTYKGKGTVDDQHRLVAWLFTDPAITSNSRPIATLSTGKNGDTLTFKDVPATPVYLFVAFDQKGGYDGRSGPPPAGIPTALYSKGAKGEPTAVKAGGAPLKIAFDDSHPWNK